MSNSLPAPNHESLLTLMRKAIDRCRLDLSGLVILTEAASGAYGVTPILAAMAGAKAVYAVTKQSPFGSVAKVIAETAELARQAGVSRKIAIRTEKRKDLVAEADIITNSGHVRPIDAEMVGWMKSTAVIPLMYEAWEFRARDVDLPACRRRGIPVAGTNERHPAVDVFSLLGVVAVKLLVNAGIAVPGSRVLLLCDNPFLPFIQGGLTRAGAWVEVCRTLSEPTEQADRDVVLVALLPQAERRIGVAEAQVIAKRWPGTRVAQFWGDIDRDALCTVGIPFWPRKAPAPGHMGILVSDLGPDPIVRLQAGGLKVGEVLRRPAARRTAEDEVFVDEILN